MIPKILLIGDSCVDEYYYGSCDRLSPEAPVPVLKINRMETKVGMAANVLLNLKAFGCDVEFITSDCKSIKKRYIDERSRQHILRVDDDQISTSFNPANIISDLSQYTAIIISDYNKGFITYQSVKMLKALHPGPIFIDSKKRDLGQFEGCFVKINQSEYEILTSKPSHLIVTHGHEGAWYKNKLFPAVEAEVVDGTGAGDTFLAALVYEYLNTKEMADAIMFANKASAITVSHSGVYSLTAEDIRNIREN
jgi:D-beta-D-heptose 7-phosphate kinase/D-beta-D-heptose 1-phosphate adenosyltransferase